MTREEKNLLVKDLCGGQYRPFGFDKKDLKGIIEPKSNEYCCPNCGTEPPDDDEGYVVDGKTYPQCYNEYLCSTDNGTIHDWDEVHKCPKCKTLFYFRNGCF